MRRLLAILVVALAWSLVAAVPAQAGSVRLARIAGNLNNPVYITAAPGDGSRLFIVLKGGIIRVMKNGQLLSTPFLNLTGSVSTGGEQGLLSMAFDPNYRTNGRFFVSYTNPAGDSRVVAYHRATADRADPETARLFLAVDQPYSNHNGGMIAFGPDGKLYVGFGDGGGAGDPANRGQRKTGYLAKILRLDVSRRPPLIVRYAYGLRNPWRFSFDRATGNLWIGDVGQGAYEEVDAIAHGTAPGTNLGWSYYEGRHVFKPQQIDRSRLKFPGIEYRHVGGNCSITGGYVYRGTAIPPLRGYYIYADFCSGKVWRRLAAGGRPVEMSFSGDVGQISSFGQGAFGELFMTSLSGSVYRLIPGP
jgi:glucose/arabinose dehydrogenase